MDKKTAAAKAEAKRQENIKTTVEDYAFVGALADMYPELNKFFSDLKNIIKNSPTGTINPNEYNALKAKRNPDGTPVYGWFAKRDADQLAAEKEMADDRLNGTHNYQASIDVKKTAIKELADQYGVPLDEQSLNELAKQAKYENWEPAEIRTALATHFSKIGVNGDLTGDAGNIQQQLQQWAAKNGLAIPGETLNRMIASGAFGKQTVDDMKAELRKTYLAGANPAWADKIAAGADPYDISAPYRSRAATLLERGDADSVSMDDPLIQRAMQHTDAAGKPAVLPLYEFDKIVRSTNDWQKTDNAYATYANVAQNVLKTFGFA